MLYSMTGFGKASVHHQHKTYTIEIRSVNGRHLDVRFKLPNTLKSKELELRSMIAQHALRGKVDFNIVVNSEEGDEDYTLNLRLLKQYYKQLDIIRRELNTTDELIPAILKLPNVVKPNDEDVTGEEWQAVIKGTTEALESLKTFRKQEGDALYEDLRLRSINILTLLDKTGNHEEERQKKVRERLENNLKELVQNEVDQNRFEQELLYYLEKYDITEEKVRLEQHCNYFMDVLDGNDDSKGRKLNFISQEMGREINTLGAKANDASMQRLVVQMKDELEKIKEQVANVI
jgi:uncharacterized protein (TIGR00255 family)